MFDLYYANLARQNAGPGRQKLNFSNETFVSRITGVKKYTKVNNRNYFVALALEVLKTTDHKSDHID